jgi:hypothetical protein
MFAGAASAVPVDFVFLSSNTVGGDFPVEQTFMPGLPILGSGNIDFASGTGTVTLPKYSIILDVNSDANAGDVTTVYGYTVVPEPGTALLLGGGLMAMAMGRKRRLS